MNAPATFQWLMSRIFSGKKWSFVSVYLDDLLIVSRTIEEHVSHVREVLVRLKEAGLHLKPSKYVFATDDIEYLGHTLTPDGVQPNNKKIVAVSNFPVPKSVKEVKKFLGFANFYHRFIPDMATFPATYGTHQEE